MSTATEQQPAVHQGLPGGFELRAQCPGFFWASRYNDIDCTSVHALMTASEQLRVMPVLNGRGWEMVWPS